MVEDVIVVILIHDRIIKSQVIFFTDFIKRGLVWWKETLFEMVLDNTDCSPDGTDNRRQRQRQTKRPPSESHQHSKEI